MTLPAGSPPPAAAVAAVTSMAPTQTLARPRPAPAGSAGEPPGTREGSRTSRDPRRVASGGTFESSSSSRTLVGLGIGIEGRVPTLLPARHSAPPHHPSPHRPSANSESTRRLAAVGPGSAPSAGTSARARASGLVARTALEGPCALRVSRSGIARAANSLQGWHGVARRRRYRFRQDRRDDPEAGWLLAFGNANGEACVDLLTLPESPYKARGARAASPFCVNRQNLIQARVWVNVCASNSYHAYDFMSCMFP